MVHPRELIKKVLEHKALSIIIAHNHPSGDTEPSQEDYDVTLVNDGVEAIEAMDSSVFDMVLLDINMPNLKGDELIKRKQEMKLSNSDIPYLALTANVAKEDVKAYKGLGFSDVIPKPFTAKQFVTIIKKHIF